MTVPSADATRETWELHPVDAARWPDLLQLFGTAGGREGCWCMRWRLPRELFERERGDPNRLRLQRGIAEGRVHGILAYTEGRPVGWCAFGPRQQFPVLATSDALAALDDVPVWSVSCFYVSPQARRRGLNAALLQAAGQHARSLGATVLEGYVWHSNRHTFASRLVMAGVDLRTVQELGGWKTAAMVFCSRPGGQRPF